MFLNQGLAAIGRKISPHDTDELSLPFHLADQSWVTPCRWAMPAIRMEPQRIRRRDGDGAAQEIGLSQTARDRNGFNPDAPSLFYTALMIGLVGFVMSDNLHRLGRKGSPVVSSDTEAPKGLDDVDE